MLLNLAIWPICPIGSRNVPVPEVRSPDTLPACRMHAEYPLANLDDDMIWNDLMKSQHDNLSRGSPRLMTSDRQVLYPHGDEWENAASRLGYGYVYQRG